MLPNPTYQQYLQQRYRAVLADDVDDYPAIARDLFDILLNQGAVGAFTYNPDGQVRLGLNADPSYLEGLAGRCQVKTLTGTPVPSLAEFAEDVVNLVIEPIPIANLPPSIQSIQTTSRAALLRQTAEIIIDHVKSGQIQPGEILQFPQAPEKTHTEPSCPESSSLRSNRSCSLLGKDPDSPGLPLSE